jgi:hypothetical protein
MPFGPRQAARGGPTPVAIHDDGDMRRRVGPVGSFGCWRGGVGHEGGPKSMIRTSATRLSEKTMREQ